MLLRNPAGCFTTDLPLSLKYLYTGAAFICIYRDKQLPVMVVSNKQFSTNGHIAREGYI